MKRRLLSALLAMAMLLTMVPAAFAVDSGTGGETGGESGNTVSVGKSITLTGTAADEEGVTHSWEIESGENSETIIDLSQSEEEPWKATVTGVAEGTAKVIHSYTYPSTPSDPDDDIHLTPSDTSESFTVIVTAAEEPEPPETEEPGTEIPEETCDVEYKEQSEGVTVTYDGESDPDYILINVEISEQAPENPVIHLHEAITACINEYVGYILPGNAFPFKVTITNYSGREYMYKQGSFVLATANAHQWEQSAALGYDGQLVPLQFIGAIALTDRDIYQGLFGVNGSADVTAEMLFDIYSYLKEKGYTGEDALTKFILDKKEKETVSDLNPDTFAVAGSSGIRTISKEELERLKEKYPHTAPYAYVTPNDSDDSLVNVQMRWPEPELAAYSYDVFYQDLWSVVYGEEEFTQQNPNSNVSFTRTRGIGDYTPASDLYQQTDDYLSEQLSSLSDQSAEFVCGLAWDGPGIGNGYMNYSMAYYNAFELEEVKPVTITPADITIYTGGKSYGSVVDGSGNEIGEADNGLPAPGYHIDLPGYVTSWLESHGVTVNQENAANLADCLSFYYYDEAGTAIRQWKLENQGVYSRDTAGNINRYVYSLSPNQIEGEDYGVEVRLQFTDPDDPDGKPIISDDITMAENLVSDTYDMTIYGGGLNQQEIKAVFTAVDESLTCDVDIGTGELLVKSTTNEEITNAIESSETAVADDTITAVADDKVTYYVNESEVVVGSDRVQLLVDEVSNSKEFNANMGSDAIAKVQKMDNTLSNLSYDTAYMDLVDTQNGNTVATMGKDDKLAIYWPAPSNAASDSKYYIAHYTEMDREDVTDAGALAGAETDLIEGELVPVNGNKYVKFDVSGFSPFVLVWETTSSGGGGGGGGHDKPEDLNTEDHFAYIIGYPGGTVQPQGDITRAEVATIFFRMLTDEARAENWSQTNNYTDVAPADWYNNAISTLTNMGIISGEPDGSFRPNDPITRAEFTKIAVGFFEEAGNYVEGTFVDVPANAWYADFIDAAVDLGLIEGYPDGTIRPEATITRAEACTIVNRTLGRVPDKDHLLPEEDMVLWPDNSDVNAWYYAQMQEATNSHDYEWTGEGDEQVENWTEKLEDRDWDALETEWSEAGDAPGGEVMD